VDSFLFFCCDFFFPRSPGGQAGGGLREGRVRVLLGADCIHGEGGEAGNGAGRPLHHRTQFMGCGARVVSTLGLDSPWGAGGRRGVGGKLVGLVGSIPSPPERESAFRISNIVWPAGLSRYGGFESGLSGRHGPRSVFIPPRKGENFFHSNGLVSLGLGGRKQAVRRFGGAETGPVFDRARGGWATTHDGGGPAVGVRGFDLRGGAVFFALEKKKSRHVAGDGARGQGVTLFLRPTLFVWVSSLGGALFFLGPFAGGGIESWGGKKIFPFHCRGARFFVSEFPRGPVFFGGGRFRSWGGAGRIRARWVGFGKKGP